jgi:hypothetical protein
MKWADDMPADNPPLTADMVRHAETLLGVRLPPEYLALLKQRNGGYFEEVYAFPTRPNSWSSEGLVPFTDLNGIGVPAEEPGGLNILDRDYLAEEWGLPPKQVLLTGEGHWWITLDYRRGPVPQVSWIAGDAGEDFVLADSFADFLTGLIIEPS